MYLGFFILATVTGLISKEGQFASETGHIHIAIPLPEIYSLTDTETSQ